MIADPDRFEKAVALFDEANAGDPHTEVVEGGAHPKELLYARRMTERLEVFAPEASEALRLAVRCQHIRRWTVPRSEYPMDRTGYKQWRNRLMAFHAETAAGILQDAGYDEATIERVQALLRKRRLKRDPEVQILEDVVCLVFLEHYAADFAAKHEEDKLIEILRKTWLKMSPAGRDAALALSLPAPVRDLVEKALTNA